MLLLAAPPLDGGARFSDSALGLRLAGQGVIALEERWATGLADEALLARCEQAGDTLSVALYQPGHTPSDGGATTFTERLRVPVPESRSLERVESESFASGPGLLVIGHGDEPDEQAVGLVAIGPGPKVLLRASGLRSVAPDGRALDLARGPQGFEVLDGGAVIEGTFARSWLALEGSDGGVHLSLGDRVQRFVVEGTSFHAEAAHFVPFLEPLGHASSKGGVATLTLPGPAPIRALELSGEGAPLGPLMLSFDEGPQLALDAAHPGSDARIFGVAQVVERARPGGPRTLVVFDPPIPARSVRVSGKDKALKLRATAYRSPR